MMKKLIYLYFLLFISCQALAQSPVNQLYQEALQAHKNQDYNTYLNKVLEIEQLLPNRPAVIYRLASAYALTGNQKLAISNLKKLIWLRPDPKLADDEDFASIKHKGKFKKVIQHMQEMLKPINESAKAFELPELDFHPEGLAYDPATASFYCSSIRKQKIIKIDRNGVVSEFIPSGQDSLMSVSGMQIDPIHRVLWVCTGAIPNMEGFSKNQEGQTAIFKYDLTEGKLLKKYTLPKDEKVHYLGDLILHPQTNAVFTTDSYSSTIYTINPQTDQLEKYFSDSRWTSLQGLAFSDDGNYLFVADYRTNVYRLDTQSKNIRTLNTPQPVLLVGVDGLYFYKNSLIAIHNGITPFRVVEYILDDQLEVVKKYDILEHATPELNEPTLGVFCGDEFYYVANSPWGAYDRKGNLLQDKLKKGLIMKIRPWETGESLQKAK
ncbi:MAG: TPR end-of-group domain-containing protein [Flammeovirgaceae bacterium]